MNQSESQEWGRLTVRLVKSFGQAVDTNELEWDSRWGRITVRLVISLGQAVHTHELEWASKLGKLTVRLVKSFGQAVDTPDDFTSLTVNLPHSWLSLWFISIYWLT
jgi:hypothetical protein